tara:strand:- start:620 stop:844 length:225 start_codon:yes stop_codon:yes gene_type:complete
VLVESYYGIVANEEVNGWQAEFVREKIRVTVKDPVTAAILMPTYLIATNCQVQDEGYFESFNRDMSVLLISAAI